MYKIKLFNRVKIGESNDFLTLSHSHHDCAVFSLISADDSTAIYSYCFVEYIYIYLNIIILYNWTLKHDILLNTPILNFFSAYCLQKSKSLKCMQLCNAVTGAKFLFLQEKKWSLRILHSFMLKLVLPTLLYAHWK